MKTFRRYILLPIFAFSLAYSGIAQKRGSEWQVGYYAAYLSNIGGTAGFAFDVKEWGENSDEQRKSVHRLQLLTQIGYFMQLNVSNNIILNPEVVYKWNKLDKRFFLTSSIGAGYILSLQRQDGTVNLATGEIEYRNAALNYFMPNLNIGLGLDPKRYYGFYLKATYGRKLSAQNADAAFVGISTGLILKFNSKG